MDIRAKAALAVSQVMGLNMLMWLTMLTLFAGLLYCAAALYLALALVLPLAIAALLVGIALMGVCVLLAVLIRLALSPPDKDVKQEGEHRIDNTVEHRIRPVIGDRATDWTRDNTGLAVIGALAAGVILTSSPKLRHFAVRAVGPIFTRKIIRAVQDFTD